MVIKNRAIAQGLFGILTVMCVSGCSGGTIGTGLSFGTQQVRMPAGTSYVNVVGTITDAQHHPLSNLTVHAQSQHSEDTTGVTDKGGHFEINVIAGPAEQITFAFYSETAHKTYNYKYSTHGTDDLTLGFRLNNNGSISLQKDLRNKNE